MSFRATLFLGIVAAVLAAALLEASLDFLANRANELVEERLGLQVEAYQEAVAARILPLLDTAVAAERVESAPLPTAEQVLGSTLAPDPGDAAEPLPHSGRYRLLQGPEVVLSGGGPFPIEDGRWLTRERDLGAGFRLETAVPVGWLERLLASRLLADVVDLPLFLALALCVAWLLGEVIMRPVRELTGASEQLALQQFPEPIEVPHGNDELSQMARSFNVMSASIHGFVERERTFTRYASHELRTPLSALKAQVERAEMGLVPAQSVLPAMERNVRRMEEVLAALLSLARSAEHERQEVVLLPLLHEVLSSFPAEARQRVTISHTLQVPLRLADRQLSGQAVHNLLDNALRYSSGPVTLAVEQVQASALIRIGDCGEGVPEHHLRRLTEPFFRVDGRGQGLGLGLSLVESISRSLGGRLELRNTGFGFEAAVSLPLAGQTAANEPR